MLEVQLQLSPFDSDMVKMSQEGSVTTVFQASVRTALKVTIYYINGALLILNWQSLYT